ncbi:MAG: class I SAM-dependent methyltransferase [Chloroflexota bacterium]
MSDPVYKAYQQWAITYDQQVNPTRDLSTAVLKQLVPDLSDLAIVEAGCGTGLNTRWLSQDCASLLALDYSDSMLAKAKKKINQPHVQFRKHDLRHPWPVGTGAIDLVVINLVLEHIDPLTDVFQHAITVMKPSAHLIITEYHPDLVATGLGARIDKGDEEAEAVSNYWHPVETYTQISKALSLQVEKVQHWRETLGEDGLPVETNVEPLLLSLVLRKKNDG